MSFTNSTFLDAFGAGLYSAEQYTALAAGSQGPLTQLFQYGTKPPSITAATDSITVGLVLDRAHDAGSLLSGNWAQRQTALAALSNSGGPWSTYGADSATYTATQNAIAGIAGIGNGPMQTASSYGYVSTAADRTIWLTLTPGQFNTLFGQNLLQVTNPDTTQTVYAWTGSLGLPGSISNAVKGLWIEESVTITNPAIMDSHLVPPTIGPQGIGNNSTNQVIATPAAIAASYKFPLPTDVATGPIALVESDVSVQSTLFADYNLYRQQVGLPAVTQAQFQVLSGTNNTTPSTIGELTLDISVIAGAAPNSTQLLYSYLSSHRGTPYNAYQQAFFDSTNHPAVLSSSYPVTGQPTANSPFQFAWQQLFVDGALANVSVLMAGGDEGANGTYANGIANLANTHSSPFSLIVGGTSIASLASSLSDSTLSQLLTLAMQDDPGTVFQLVASGLRILPTNLSGATPAPSGQAATLQTLFETVWQALSVTPAKDDPRLLDSAFGSHQTGTGGVAITGIPSYQRDYGLSALTGGHRGAPDVAALSSGDSQYAVLNQNYVNSSVGNALLHGDGGTSAAAPLWASLTTQFNAIFHDQGLPNLGFYNDLLYIASVIAPGSFNDVQLGNNDNSYTTLTSSGTTGYFNTSYLSQSSIYNVGVYMTPTGQGYSAMAGYDLASGLGTPNGTLLARALTAIAHSQVSFGTSPAMLDSDGHGGWVSGTDQNLLLQATTPSTSEGVGVAFGGHGVDFASGEPGSFSWSARLAQQSLQPDFDPGLALLFDKQAQGSVMQSVVHQHEAVSVSIGAAAGQATQAGLSNPFGFDDFFSGSDAVRLARPVAIAETVGGQSDQMAVVRLRQVGSDNLSVSLYRVDNLQGAIGDKLPGDAAYAAAAEGRAYQTISGATPIAGPGYGQFEATAIQHVNAGDMVALKLIDNTTGFTFFGFAQANEVVGGQHIAHLWNYGLNTWGFEDTYGGGDHDFNDMIVQVDFTSASGHGWLV